MAEQKVSPVKIVSITKPASAELEHLTPEELIVYIARVSNPSNQLNTETAPKLLKYCIKHQHWSIFEHVYVTMEINTTRAIAPQILRHRSFTFQEFCVHGKTKLTLIKKNKQVKMSIKKLYSEAADYSEYKIQMFDLSTNTFIFVPIVDVFYTGYKPCYEFTFCDGKKIVCTAHHQFCTELKTFVQADRLFDMVIDPATHEVISFNNFPAVLLEGKPSCSASKPKHDRHNVGEDGISVSTDASCVGVSKLQSVKFVGYSDTYDLCVDHPDHNYIANGIVVHNSQRYAEATEIDTNIEARLQDTKNRQNSIEISDWELKCWFQNAQEEVASLAMQKYKEALAKGIAKEQARFLLPLSTKTKLYMTGNMRSWIHYIQLRGDKATQKEHREIALAIKEQLAKVCPTIISILDEEKSNE